MAFLLREHNFSKFITFILKYHTPANTFIIYVF